MLFCLWDSHQISVSNICVKKCYTIELGMGLTYLWWDKARVPSIIVVEMANIVAGGDQHASA